MTSYINATLRRLVAIRADYLCEYCLIYENDTFFGCQVDHIISEKHGGQTETDNLAYACAFCNRAKGSDIGSIIPGSGTLIRFFNPRTDRWFEHFALHEIMIIPVSPIGEVTARILNFNDSERLLERQNLRALGRYPSAAALRRLRKYD